MGKMDYIKKISERLDGMGISHQVGQDADLTISATLKREEDDDKDSKRLIYFASLLVNEKENTAYVYENVTEADGGDIKTPDYQSVKVQLEEDDEEKIISIGAILGTPESLANSSGYSFVRTGDKKNAAYPMGKMNSEEKKESAPAGASRFCTKCGAKIKEDAKFCPKCGNATKAAAVPIKTPTSKDTQRQATAVKYEKRNNPKKGKKPLVLIILISLIIVGIAIVGIALGGNRKDKDDTSLENGVVDNGNSDTTPGETTTPGKSATTDSAIVSSGVSSSDLGNIMNGQYYFATEDYIFYSSYDEDDKAHIYSVNKDDNKIKPIFDGFGWSLVVVDEWLYFSGNQGELIDGTYNIFRMRFDGSQVERINNEYSYGMNIYGDYLYYMKRNPEYQDSMSVCRSALDGSNEEVLFPNGFNPVIYQNQLYYHDNPGNMFRTDPDGSNPQVLASGEVESYIMSEGRIIYRDYYHNIYTCEADGGNKKLIRESTGDPINSINAAGDRIFFSIYDENFNYNAYGWDYTIKSCKMDGSDEKAVFSSVSYGIYMNIVNSRLMCMDYIRSEGSEVLSAKIKAMDLDGGNLETLGR